MMRHASASAAEALMLIFALLPRAPPRHAVDAAA